MEWTKIPTDLLQSRKSDKEIIAIVKYQMLWAMLERQPEDDVALRYMTSKQLQQARDYITAIEWCVNADIKSVEKARRRQKIFYEKKQSLKENSNGYTNAQTNDNTNAKTNDTDKIRLDKIRLDNKEKENKKKKNYDAEFEEWWKICPKKVEKDTAYKKFKSILAEKKATIEELMDGMNRYRQKCIRDNTEDHYIKHPITWLNAGCWKDDYNAWKNMDDKVPKSGGIGEWDKTPETYTVGDY